MLGVGVLRDPGAAWSGRVAEAVLHCHDHKPLRTSGRNRLQNYLRVTELQDAALHRP